MSVDSPRYRRLYTHEWHDPAFRLLNDGARVVRLYITAGPQTTSCGCFRLSTAIAVEDLGGTSEAFEERLLKVCEAFNYAWDPVARVIWLRDWFDLNPPASPNVVASWAKLLRNVPDCQVKFEAIATIARALKNLPQSFREPFADLSKSFPKPEIQSEVRPETYQGSGNREQRSGKTGNRLAHDENVPDAVIRLAHRTITEHGRGTSDQLVDALQYYGRETNLTVSRTQAIKALTIVSANAEATA